MFLEPFVVYALYLCLGLACYGVLVEMLRVLFLGVKVSPFGHVVHGPVMVYMSATSLGLAPEIVPSWVCASFFMLCACMCLYRLIADEDSRGMVTYIFHCCSAILMMYMFLDQRLWNSGATSVLVFYYLVFSRLYFLEHYAHADESRGGVVIRHLTTQSHIAVGCAMVLMLCAMHYQARFGVVICGQGRG